MSRTIEIHVAHVEALGRAFATARGARTDLDTLAERVRQVPPLTERVLQSARAQARYPVGSLREAVLLLGCRGVEEQACALAAWWLHALETPHGARIVGAPVVTPFPLAG